MQTILTTTSRVKAALKYAELGLRVIPLHTVGAGDRCSCGRSTCPSPGKHPQIKGWRTRATTNPYTIQFHWRRFPDANIGILTGQGLAVIDFDDLDVYRAWRRQHPQIAETLTARTGGGGRHAYVYVSEPLKTYLHAGGEVRSDGAYVVAPPSRHVAGSYRWLKSTADILTATPDELPERVTASVTPVDVRFSGADGNPPDLSQWPLSHRILQLIHEPPPIGQRSEADMSVIVALVAGGASDDEVRAVFRHYPIGINGKYAGKGRYADRYLAHSIGKARAYVAGQDDHADGAEEYEIAPHTDQGAIAARRR